MHQTLEIENENNKLLCDAFVQIGPEPPRPWPARNFDRLYTVRVNGDDLFFQLLDFIRLPFKDIGSAYTIPAAGMESVAWKQQYRKQNPQVTDYTMMAIYFFKKM